MILQLLFISLIIYLPWIIIGQNFYSSSFDEHFIDIIQHYLLPYFTSFASPFLAFIGLSEIRKKLKKIFYTKRMSSSSGIKSIQLATLINNNRTKNLVISFEYSYRRQKKCLFYSFIVNIEMNSNHLSLFSIANSIYTNKKTINILIKLYKCFVIVYLFVDFAFIRYFHLFFVNFQSLPWFSS
jgi:hypothetical protein